MAKIMKVVHSCAECIYLKRYKREGINNDIFICEINNQSPMIIAVGESEAFFEKIDKRCPLETYVTRRKK